MNPHSLPLTKALLGAVLLTGLIACNAGIAGGNPVALPDPKVDAPLAAGQGDQVAVLAGGCFWGVEAVFEHVKGVKQAVSGYSGGSQANARYDAVGSGRTRHAEAVRIVYDPAVVSYGQLLEVYFSVAHDPTQINRQGPDTGPQYRSAIFYGNDLQKKIASAYIAQLTAAKSYPAPIVTEVAPLQAFYPAEAYHQDFARRNPTHPYIAYHDAPKVANLKRMFPALLKKG